MIFTGNKALQFLSVPVYTIFKNLTIIVIAYGEVLWFGGSVSALSLVSFALMVFSSIVAAWSDFSNAKSLTSAGATISTLNAGYAWMLLNVFCAAMYVLSMRKAIKATNFKNWDGEYDVNDAGGIPANRCSHVLQQHPDDSRLADRVFDHRGLVFGQPAAELSG